MTDFNPNDKRIRCAMFMRGALMEFTRNTPMTPEDISWALAFMAGSAIGQPEYRKNLAPGMTVHKARNQALVALDLGIDSATRAADAVPPLIIN